MKPLICVDFDGTIFDGKNVFPECIESLKALQQMFRIGIFSARVGVDRDWMLDYLIKNAIPHDALLAPKPDAVAFIDDKGVSFEGDWRQAMVQALCKRS